MNEYYYINRPPGIGCQPTGFDIDTRETWVPRRELDGMYYWGKVSYPEPLTYDEIRGYDLRPVSRVEYAHYTFWGMDAEGLKDEYLECTPEHLLGLVTRSHDILASAALVILEAQEGDPDVTL